MADLPSSLRIGPFVYSVQPQDPRQAARSQELGHCNRTAMLIEVVTHEVPLQKQAEVLIHEVCHAIYDSGNLGSCNSEEDFVEVLGYQLTQVWRDNPQLVKFMEAVFRPDTETP